MTPITCRHCGKDDYGRHRCPENSERTIGGGVMTHYMKKCIYCQNITEQCKCPSKDKAVIEDICQKCLTEKYSKILSDIKTKTLIGTCGDCQFYITKQGKSLNPYNVCENPKSLMENKCPPPNDGCIHWKEKNDVL